jgi:hypothetical protein
MHHSDCRKGTEKTLWIAACAEMTVGLIDFEDQILD